MRPPNAVAALAKRMGEKVPQRMAELKINKKDVLRAKL
jgi:hypothetical protein